jgi:7-cyano-7-deazaguanine synthase
LDSATALAIAKAEGYEPHVITFNYHQRHARELESARMIASSAGVAKHLVVDFDLRDIGGSALTAEIEVPKDGTRDSGSGVGRKEKLIPNPQPPIPVTYVPARNTIFLSFALAWAEVLEAGSIFIGANAIDYSGYPDCRPQYLSAFEHMANLATRASVEGRLRFIIEAPLVTMTKAEIIRKGTELGVDYSLTWSCYDPQPSNVQKINIRRARETSSLLHVGADVVPCRRCDSCMLREKGFREAGIEDPLV